jgi:type VI secretion system protein ImpE
MTAQPMPHVTSGATRHVSPATQIAHVEAEIRRQPALAAHRWTLFQLLCITYEWPRAVQQLQVYAQLELSQASVAQACRDLVRAELWRGKVMAGLQKPGVVFDGASGWMEGMLDALRLAAKGQLDASDEARERALELAPLVSGKSAGHTFDWIGDSDSRLGPVCEVMTAGRYRWLSLADIRSWRIERPTTLIDLVWASCTLTLKDGTVVRGFMPARYPIAADPVERVPEALQLGCETIWRDAGRTGVIASGRKTWTTSAGDFDLFELPECEFGVEQVDDSGAYCDAERGPAR